MKFQKRRILPGADDIGKHSPRAMTQCRPQPALGRFGPNETPHFIELGCATSLDTDRGAAQTRKWYQRAVGVLKRRGFFLTRRSRLWDCSATPERYRGCRCH